MQTVYGIKIGLLKNLEIIFGYWVCMDIQKPWMNIWIYGLYGYSETLEAYLDIGVEWIFRNLWKHIWI